METTSTGTTANYTDWFPDNDTMLSGSGWKDSAVQGVMSTLAVVAVIAIALFAWKVFQRRDDKMDSSVATMQGDTLIMNSPADNDRRLHIYSQVDCNANVIPNRALTETKIGEFTLKSPEHMPISLAMTEADAAVAMAGANYIPQFLHEGDLPQQRNTFEQMMRQEIRRISANPTHNS